MTDDSTRTASGSDDAADTPGGEPPREVEDRAVVGTVTPDQYPDVARRAGQASPPLDDDQEYERQNPGSGSDSTPA